MPRDDVKRLILARRARFVAAALAGMATAAACGGKAVVDGEPRAGSGGAAVGGAGGSGGAGSGGMPQPCLGTPADGGGGAIPGPCLTPPQSGGAGGAG